MNTEVVIIGAGPTGLMAACQLARYGTRFIIIDTKAKPTSESRAMVVTARSMEIYDQMGLSEKIRQQGKSIKNFSIFVDGQCKADIPIGEAGEGLTDFPYLQVFEQSKNEELLYAELKQQGLDVQWNTEFISVEQNNDQVTVQLKNSGSTEEISTIQAKYLIGCDGAGSSVRHKLGCKFEGGTYANQFFVADTHIDWNQSEGKVFASLSKLNFCAFFPMHGDNNFRVLGTMPKSYQNNKSIGFKDLEAVIKSTIQIPLVFKKVNWFSTYQLHHRCVDKFKIGRCFLAGDAAHIHSPAGGQGMNTGLQDAYNISWKIAMVLQNLAGNKLLDSYHTERYPFAKWLLRFTDRLFYVMTSSNVIAAWFRLNLAPLFMRQALSRKSLRTNLFRTISQIWYSYKNSPLSVHLSKQRLKFRAGDRFPHVKMVVEGELKSGVHLLRDPKFHLVIISGNATEEDMHLIPQKLASFITLRFFPISEVWESLGVKDKLYILVRPDNYIGMLSDHLDEKALRSYFDQLS